MSDSPPELSEERIAAYLRGELSAQARRDVEAALDREPQWLAVVAMLARGEARDGPTPPPSSEDDDASLVERLEREHEARIRPGMRLGRYEVEQPLGRGGMGVVVAAHDPELGRRVALKLLHGTNEREQARLLREARALAQLNDRHVITVNDVGTVDGRVFIAMELLEGQTLLQWCREGPRPWSQVLAAFVDAGRGLAAAHTAGLVHRDFKPANVMMTDDGRVVVLDFGLAREFEQSPSEPQPEGQADRTDDPETADLTRTGQRLGTPAYMAPEQRKGLRCGPATDQFSYCVALWEALFGCLPEQAAHPGRSASFDAAAGPVPSRLRRLLTRGLAEDPDQRHPQLSGLVDELHALLRPRAQWWAPVTVAALSGAAVALALVSSEPPPCTGSAQRWAESFDETKAAAVASALSKPDIPWTERVRDDVGARLNTYGQSWVAEHRAACRATRIEGSDSEAVLDLRMLCLDRRRRAFGALVEVLTDADVEAAAQAVQAVDALAPVSDCRNVERLQAAVPLPSGDDPRAEAAEIFDRIGRVEALRRARRYDDAAALAEATVQRAVALAHPPTEADARLVWAWVLTDQGHHERAETELRRALDAAETGQHDEAVAIAWNRLAWVVGYRRAQFDEGRRLAEHARAWNARLGDAPLHELSRLRALGWIEHDAGNTEQAIQHFEHARDIAQTLPPDDPVSLHELGIVLNGLGAAALVAGKLPEATEYFTLAAEQLEEVLGPEHPDVAKVRNNVASLLRSQGQAERAHRLLVHNLEIFETTFGPGYVLVGQTAINLAVIELDLGRFDAAEAHAEQALAVLTEAMGAEHPMVSKALTTRGDARVQLGRPLQGIADFERARALEVEALGPEHPSIGIIESNLGSAYYDLDRHEDAARHHLRALEILRAALGPEHPNLALVFIGLGLTHRARGQHSEALARFREAETLASPSALPNALTRIGESLVDAGQGALAVKELDRALALQTDQQADPGFMADTHFALARAHWLLGTDRVGARAQAQQALQIYEDDNEADPAARVRAWLAEHPISD
ncbi:MAG: serine/threonine-protein kinase [Myxococcota bacterium]